MDQKDNMTQNKDQKVFILITKVCVGQNGDRGF